jgi:iron complex outermembrane receptor protein
VYDPLFSGVFWNVQDVLLEDLDRIEVIRGPGSTLWGANAVSGVINITTKTARETQGFLVTGGGGNVDQGFGAIRYGGALSEDAHFRLWAKYDNYAAFQDRQGNEAPTDWDMYRGGFRVDWTGGDDLELTLQGDLYATGHIDDEVRVAVPGHLTFQNEELNQQYQGGNTLFRVGRHLDDQTGWDVQAYYDRTKTRGGQPGFEVRRDTFDLDFRQHRPLGESDEHTLAWGLGYRHSRDRTSGGPTLFFEPRSRSLDTFSGFIQGTLSLVPEKVALMVGSKFEHNDNTGFEFQPSGRLSWSPDDRRTIWGAISRAVRTPSRIADDTRLTTAFADPGLLAGGPPTGSFVPLRLIGDPDVDSEQLIAYEAGYRARLTDSMTMDAAAFYNDYDDLITFSRVGTFGNRGEASTYGFELSGTWQPSEVWTLAGSYSLTRVDFDSPDGDAEEGETPQQAFKLRSFLDVTEDLEFNSAVYYVDSVPDEGADAYLRLDLGLTWRPTSTMEVSIWGQNLRSSAASTPR